LVGVQRIFSKHHATRFDRCLRDDHKVTSISEEILY